MLRPILFKIISTTQLKIGFNYPVADNISIDNFKVEAISGSDTDIEILSIQIDGSSILLNTRPHHAKAYYVLKLQDTDTAEFVNTKGLPLINDDISRDIYFIGINKPNQIRDDIFFKTPSIYNLQGSLVESVLSNQASQLLQAQHDIGSLLNDNYISQTITDEYRVRGQGATDRLSNENGYQIDRISTFPTNSSILAKTIEIEPTTIYPICLRQELVDSFQIDSSTTSAIFKGFLVSLPNKNIIKVSYAKLIKSNDIQDCDGNIGTEYNLARFKYSLLKNRYDQENSLPNYSLESNQILFSDFGNWERPEFGDTIIISYYYDNSAISIINSSIQVYETTSVLNESIPSNSKNFSLSHGLIIDSSDEQPELYGVSFKKSENSTSVPAQFLKELIYNFSSLPSQTGEFSINYETGDVFVVGTTVGEGTGYNYFFADYRYKKVYKQDLDYSLLNSEINLNYLRPLFGKTIKISFDYELIFAEGIDYKPMTHQEVLGEMIENRVTSSFSLTTKNSPITDVFRIYNQTTGEVYSLNYFNGNEVFFTGNKLPSGKEVFGESLKFTKKSGEELYASGIFISPVHYGTITSNLSNLNIEFSPGLPSEFIDELSTNYVIRFLEQNIDDYKITAFYAPDTNGLIKGFSIASGLTLPSTGTAIQIGTNSLIFNLPDNRILNATGDGVGSALNSSLEVDGNLFQNEKFFKPISSNNELTVSSSGSQTYVISSDQAGTLNTNLSRLRKFGDYSVDYQNGVIYLSVNSNSSFNGGLVAYLNSIGLAKNNNVISVINAYKTLNNSDSSSLVPYSSFDFSKSTITIKDLETTTSIYDGSDIISNSGEIKERLFVDESYTLLVDRKISSIKYIGYLEDIFGLNLDSTVESERYLESGATTLLLKANNGGKNIYIPEYVSFSDNIIDFKSSSTSKFYTSGPSLEIKFKTIDFNAIFEVLNQGGTRLLDPNLNFIVDSEINVSSIINYSTTEYQVFFDSVDSKYSFNSGFDYIWNGTDRWLITGFSTSGYFIINKASEVYSLNFSETSFDLVIRPIILPGTQTTISYPVNNFISVNSIATLKYVTTYSPQPGSGLAVDYSSGNIFVDYVHLNDEIIVYYEYGDNEIDWSINNSISEGQSYFVTYKYGALRSALKRNFGRLTSIPFFNNQSLSIDRELYRDAVAGVLSAFPKGPTIPAISGLVKSVVKTNPEINELTFGSWILGRDYLSPESVSYKGSLEFLDGRFGSGLRINKDNVISIPSVSNLSLDEGTVEMWVTPDWYGVNNDADLTFSFTNIGNAKWFYIGGDPFSSKSGYDVVGSWDTNDARHGFDFSGNKLRIYKVSSEQDGYVTSDYNALFGVYKKELSLNRETSILQTSEFLINYSYLPRNSSSFSELVTSGSYRAAGLVIDNDHKTMFVKVAGSTYKDAGLTKLFLVESETSDSLLDFGPPYPTASCKCSFPSQIGVLENFDKLEIKITFNDYLLKSDLFSENFWGSESPGSLIIVDEKGRFFQVSGLGDLYGKRYTSSIPDIISEIYLSRYPINYPELTGKDYNSINDISFSQFIIVKKQISLELKEDQKSSLFYSNDYIWNFNWDNKIKVISSINPITNQASIGSGLFTSPFFYTDLPDSNLYSIVGDTVTSKSTAIGVFGISSMNIFKNLIDVKYKFNYNDIWIGSAGVHPNSNIFTLNRFDSKIDSNGISYKFDTQDGIYIGYDSECLSPINNNIGQWVLRARFLKYSQLPYDVEISDSGAENLMEYVSIDSPVIGRITSSGAFSSITKGRRTISDSCKDTATCSKHFRFLGNKLLDFDGWSLMQESESEFIDIIHGGREAESFSWRRLGEFQTENSSGIYRVSSFTSLDNPEDYFSSSAGLTVQNSCNLGNIELVVSAKIVSIDSGVYSLSNNGVILSSGITIAEINSGDYDLGITLDVDVSLNGLVSIYNFANGQTVSSESFNWNDSLFHKYTLLIDRENSIVTLYIDNVVVSQKDLSSIATYSADECSFNSSPSFSTIFVDQRLISSENYITALSSPIIDLNLVESNSNYNPGIIKLEDSDIFIVSNSSATFELHPNPNEFDQIDIDGYITESDVDEIMITSDNERYLLDSGLSEDNSRFSIFKDGKGFLNFRIIDGNKKDPSIYNLATNIKNFIPGERHHIAASWKLNSTFEKDEMHLFIDGQESPNLFKFGGTAPLRFNSKFSDISKEVLWNYLEKKIIFPDEIQDGVVVGGTNVLNSSTLVISSDLIGRSIIFGDLSSIPGKMVIVLEVGSGWVAVGDPITTEPYIFQGSEVGMPFSLAPYSNNILTDLENERFSIFRTSCDGIEEEFGGLGYSIQDGSIIISNYPDYVGYRYNKISKLIEFVKINESCSYVSSASKTDINIHIKTYGLTGRRFRDIMSLSGTSLFSDEGSDPLGTPNSRDGYSLIMTTGPRPRNLADVIIKKYLSYNYSIPSGTVTDGGGGIFISDFELSLTDAFTSLQTVNISKNNDGRYLEIQFDSDNINYGSTNTIVVHGITPGGPSTESILVNKNGSFFTQDRYLEVEKITGQLEIIDPDYEFVSIVNVIEANSIFTQDGSGDYAEIYRFSNGTFVLSVAGSTSYSAFELPPGYYLIDYSSTLRVSIPELGHKLYIGNDITERKYLAGSVDEFQILNTKLSDLRPWEPSASGVRTITEDFYKQNPACITNSTLALIDFENPIEKQSRRLRNKKFLDTDRNFTYTLSLQDRETLLEHINNEEVFVSYMIFLGYSEETAEEVFFECSKAESGPLYNLASYLPKIGTQQISPNSVNSSFGQSGRFENRAGLILGNNNNTLRNDSGTVEFWYQPKLDTFNDGDTRVLFESSSILANRVTSVTPYLIKLATPASKILSIKLISSGKLNNEQYYSQSEKSQIIFNEITTVESTGRYSRGTGTDKDFSTGGRLSPNGLEVILADGLPGAMIDVIVTYIPKQYSGEKISIYKDPFSRIIARVESTDYAYLIPCDVYWVEESWHRISLSYNFNGNVKFIKMFIDGQANNTIYQYDKTEFPEAFDSAKIISSINFTLKEQMSQIIIGNNSDLSLSAAGLIDNLRISRQARSYPRDSSGTEYDLNYSSNTGLVSPVKSDDLTTYIQDFDFEDIERNIHLASIIDPKYGIFDFEVIIGDDFNRVVGINGGSIEDLIVDLISRIKPAHSNAYVKFIEKKCKE